MLGLLISYSLIDRTLSYVNEDMDEKENNQVTTLLTAIEQGNLDMVKSLLTSGVDVNERTVSGTTALIKALRNKQIGNCTIINRKWSQRKYG